MKGQKKSTWCKKILKSCATRYARFNFGIIFRGTGGGDHLITQTKIKNDKNSRKISRKTPIKKKIFTSSFFYKGFPANFPANLKNPYTRGGQSLNFLNIFGQKGVEIESGVMSRTQF